MARILLSRCTTILACAALSFAAHAQTTCSSTTTYTPQNPVFPQPITVNITTTDSVTPPYISSYAGSYYANEAGYPSQGRQSTFDAPSSFSFTFTPFAAGPVSVGFSGLALDPNPVCGESIGGGTTIQVAAPTAPPPTYDGFKGQYAFAFNGLNPQIKGASTRLAAVGSFTADGQGHITAGTEDVNSGAGSSTLVPITGSYTIDAMGKGALTLASSFGVQQLRFFVPKLELPLLSGTSLFSRDGYVVFGTGSLQLQTVPTADLRDLGDYALNLSGYLPCTSTCNGGESIYEAGSLAFAANPDGTYGTLSGSVGAVLLPDVFLGYTNFSGVDPVTGRFTFTLTQGPLPVVNFVGYTVDGVHLLLLSTDSHKTTYLLSGTAVQQ